MVSLFFNFDFIKPPPPHSRIKRVQQCSLNTPWKNVPWSCHPAWSFWQDSLPRLSPGSLPPSSSLLSVSFPDNPPEESLTSPRDSGHVYVLVYYLNSLLDCNNLQLKERPGCAHYSVSSAYKVPGTEQVLTVSTRNEPKSFSLWVVEQLFSISSFGLVVISKFSAVKLHPFL